jgi:outer membrane protein assembly factor BamB
VTGTNGQGFVTRLNPSGDSVWTFPMGNTSVSLSWVSSNATSFAVAGISSGTQDLDPSSSIDLLFGDIAFVSRFRF